MHIAWQRSTLLAIAIATAAFGFTATRRASAPCHSEAQRQQCIADNQDNWPGPQLDCDVMFRLCSRRTCAS